MKKINLLFTGGFDSTFRLCQLSRMENVTVQPIYLVFNKLDGIHGRPNREKEIAAQDAIISCLRTKSETKAIILDSIRVAESELPPDPDYTMAFEQWKGTGKVPGQYRLMGRLVLLYPELEIGREGPTLRNRQRGLKVGKTAQFLIDNGVKLTKQEDGSVILNFKHAKPGLEMLFGRYRYPILGIPETDMVPLIKDWGYEDVFKLTWTCDFGGDEPCGVCHNCETKWDSGLLNFFAPHAVRNHEIKKYLEQLKEQECPTPVELVPKNDLADAFRAYVVNDYRCKLDINSVLKNPVKVQEIAYKVQKLRQANMQTYFDTLIQAWDNGQKEKYLASIH